MAHIPSVAHTHSVRRYKPEPGHNLQAFCFALDPTSEQAASLRRHFGARRFAYNWAVRYIKDGIDAYHKGEVSGAAPSLALLRREWNGCIREVASWWPEVSKECFSSGISGAVDGYWAWVDSRSGERKGPKVCFPRFKKKGRDDDRYGVTTGSFGLDGRRHVKVPRVGTVRLHENARRLERLISGNRARILSATISRRGGRCFIAFQVDVLRWSHGWERQTPGPRIGVDVGVRRPATVANAEGRVLEVLENPKPLDRNLKGLRRLYRARSRRSSERSVRYRERTLRISKLHRRVADMRRDLVQKFTTRLAKSHGETLVEGLNASNLARQKNTPGVRKRRRDLADAALAEARRELRYKTVWYSGVLVEADPFFPSSKLCSGCGSLNEPGWAEYWTCLDCGVTHQRDENAAVNLARYPDILLPGDHGRPSWGLLQAWRGRRTGRPGWQSSAKGRRPGPSQTGRSTP